MRSASIRHRRCIAAAAAAALAATALAAPAADAPAKPAGEVLIYRCTDDQGRLSLRDTPCAAGQRQQTVSMMRPVDPPPRPAEAAPAAASETPARNAAPQYLVVRTAQPMYDCVRPDGSRYVSDNGDGNPRMMPLVDLGYGVPYYEGTSLGRRIGAPTPRPGDPDSRIEPRVRVADSSTRIAVGGRHGHVSYSSNSGYVIPGGYNYGYGVYYGSQLVRDECHPLPQQEVCARLRDQRWAGDRRYNSALQSERTKITEEQRVIDARLNADCGAY